MVKRSFYTALALSLSPLFSNPSDPVIVSGRATFDNLEKSLLIHAEDRTIIDWNSFSIDTDELTKFIQPGEEARVLNRVTGPLSSLINGTLEANGQVILVNPNGVIVGKSGVIHTADFIAATYDLVNKEDWSFLTEKEALESLSASHFINMEGIIRANRIADEEGKILLVADSVKVEGRLEAPSGHIEILGNQLLLEKGATIDARGMYKGGTILVGGDLQNQNAHIGSAKSTIVKEAALMADAQMKGDGGKIILWGDDQIHFFGSASAKGGPQGGNGGLVEVSSPNEWIYKGRADLRAENGAFGRLLMDPGTVTIDNFGASNPLFPTSTPPDTYNPPIGPGDLDITELNTALSMGNVDILTSAGGFGVGNITLVAGNTISWATGSQLRMVADNILSIQGEVVCTGAGNIDLSSIGGSVIVGDSASVTPSSIITGGNIDISAGNGMSIFGGSGGGTVEIETTNPAGSITIDVLNGNFVISTLTSDLVNIADITANSGPLVIDIDNGNFLNTTGGGGEIRLESSDFIDITISGNFEVSTAGNAGFRIDCASTTNNPSFINIGNDFLLSAAPNSDYEISYQFSFLTLNVGRDMTLFSSSSADGGFQPLGIGGVFNIGRNYLQIATDLGSVHVSSNDDFQLNVVNNASILNTNAATSSIIANGLVDIHVGNDLFIENTFSPTTFPGAGVAGVAGVSIDAGGSVELGNQGNIIALSGSIFVSANQNIILGPNSAIDGFMGTPTSIVLVVDDQAPTAPLIGSGAFIMDATAIINSGAPTDVQIFTARRDQNNISPLALINGATFIPGPFNVNSQTEQWAQYFPQAFVGIPFTIFYKEPQNSAAIVSATEETIGTIYDLLEEFSSPLPYYNDLFCVTYKGKDFASQLYPKAISGKAGMNEGTYCPWVEVENYRKYYPSLQRWGYFSPN